MFKYLAKLNSATIEDMCNFPNVASIFSLMFYVVIEHGFRVFSDHLFSTVTLLMLSDNVFSEIKRNFSVRKTSKQNQILDTFLVSGSLTDVYK